MSAWLAWLCLFGGDAATADVPRPRPEPVPYRLQAPLLRPVHLPAAMGARLAPPDTVERQTWLTVSVFRESDAGRADTGSFASLVGDAVAGITRARCGIAASGNWGAEYGVEFAALRYGRSPKFPDEGPTLDAEVRGVRWLSVREPTAGWLAPVAWLAGGWTRPDGAGVLLRTTLAFPGGSRTRGTGTREWGGSCTVIGGLPLWRDAVLDTSVAVVWPGSPDGLGGSHVRIAPIWQGMLSLSWAAFEGWSFHLQALVAPNPFPYAHNTRLDEPLGEIVIAARWWPISALGISLVFAEDLTRLAPDFSVALGVEYRIGASRR